VTGSGEPGADAPSVLWIWTDQQRWDALGAAGYPHVITPNLDALAASGAIFTRAYCNNPVCMPSRMSALSGRYPSTLGVEVNGIEMPDDVPCLQHVLGERGYTSANLGKLHFLNHSDRDHTAPHPPYGFDEPVISDEPGCYEDAYIAWVRDRAPDQVENCRCSTPPAWTGEPVVRQPRGTHQPYVFEGPEELTHSAFVADRTVDFLRRRGREGRFFAIAGFYAPHCPLNPPARFVEMYDPASLPAPLMNEPERERYGLSDDEWRNVRAHYYALVSHVDDQVGRILAGLDELGLRESTLVVFTSDHGEHLGDHGLIQKGPPGLDSCARVPLVISSPGRIPAGQVRNEIVELVDLAPTVLELCGVEAPDFLQGRSLGPLLTGGEYSPRSSAYMEWKNPFESSWRTVRTERFKYCFSGGGEERLFDLAEDPGELRDLAGEERCAAALADCRRELISRMLAAQNQYPLRTASY
jgi:arylsulfatase A-like enzyme